MGLHIRRATPADAEVIIDFNRLLALESEGKVLERTLLAPGVSAALADPNKALYFLAVDGDTIAGQTMITFEWSDWRNGWFWWIQSVYVRPEFRRQGIFKRLYEHIADSARRDPGVVGIRLYVERENVAAQQTYARMGMERTGYFVLEKYPL